MENLGQPDIENKKEKRFSLLCKAYEIWMAAEKEEKVALVTLLSAKKNLELLIMLQEDKQMDEEFLELSSHTTTILADLDLKLLNKFQSIEGKKEIKDKLLTKENFDKLLKKYRSKS